MKKSRWLVGLLVVVAAACHGPADRPPASAMQGTTVAEASVVMADSAFARLVDRLSEPGGYFDTDNLISNEASYLHVLGALREMDLSGGAYLGVGPDQNFSYIAQVRPSVAFLIDIRRDNLLQHIFFKAVFAGARNRVAYLTLLFGKPAPDDVAAWDDRSIQEIIDYIDQVPAEPKHIDVARAVVQDQAQHAGLALSEEDLERIDRIHTAFLSAGLDLQFTSHGRPPRYYYPTYRDLLLEKDLTGRYSSFLVVEDDFQFLKTMHARDKIVPIVGDLSGDHALKAIGAYLKEQGETVSVFYTSNVEFYLMRRGRFERFADNLTYLPLTERSVIIRSYFNRFSSNHPQSVPGYASTQLLQTLESLVAEHANGGYQSYWDLVNKHNVDLQ